MSAVLSKGVVFHQKNALLNFVCVILEHGCIYQFLKLYRFQILRVPERNMKKNITWLHSNLLEYILFCVTSIVIYEADMFYIVIHRKLSHSRRCWISFLDISSSPNSFFFSTFQRNVFLIFKWVITAKRIVILFWDIVFFITYIVLVTLYFLEFHQFIVRKLGKIPSLQKLHHWLKLGNIPIDEQNNYFGFMKYFIQTKH